MSNRVSRVGLAAVFTAVSFTAAAQNPPANLSGTAWRVVEIAGTAVPRDGSSPGREPHLVFDTTGRVSGSDGCNRLSGPYTSSGNGLDFGALIGTMMACPKVGDLPQRVRRALEGTSRYAIVDGRLQLLGATGRPLAVLERRAPEGQSQRSLLGTSWQLASITAGGNAVTPDDPSKYTLAFSAGGTLLARLDCNRGRGRWSVSGGNRLTLGPLALTRAMCPEGSLHDDILGAWAGVRTFTLQDGRLRLLPASEGTVLEFLPLAAAAPATPPGKP